MKGLEAYTYGDFDGLCNYVDPCLDSVWQYSHQQQDGIHAMVQQNVSIGSWVEYECCDDQYMSQGCAVARIVEVYVDASTAGSGSWVARAVHIWATEHYYAEWQRRSSPPIRTSSTTSAQETRGVAASTGVAAT